MNFKTTVILFVLLLAVGGYVYFTRDTDSNEGPKKIEEHKLIDVKSADVSKLVVTPNDGKPIELDRVESKWNLAAPVQASADPSEANSLVDSILNLTSTAEVDPSGKDAPRTGLDKPQYTVEVTGGGKTTKLLVGDKLGASNSVYVQIGGEKTVQVVSADLLDKLDKPASALRQAKLVQATSFDIKQVTITQKDGNVVALQKQGNDWQITQPAKMPADSSAITDLLSSITGLRAESFVDEPSAGDGLDHPRTTIFYSTVAPATQPTTSPASQPAGVTIAFGSYDSVSKKNVFVKLSDSSAVAKVAATSLDSFNKKPIDLRDKKVVDIDVADISQFTLSTDIAATTGAASKPARKSTINVKRRGDNGFSGPPMLPSPTVRPASSPANLANFKPKWPVDHTQWQIDGADADDIEVKALLDAFHPLRADKYLDKPAPTSQPAGTYSLQITAVALGGKTTEYEFHFTNPPGTSEPVTGQYKDLSFETSRSLLTNLDSTFKKKNTPLSAPAAQ